ncbi:MAG: helix-turn-helix transcriptional regulator [Microbacterium gubbeenense]|uniref:helix-turn-helix transcriptional regulator n=1 Tax=Microbacterium gubbeenense TaxID=159896 RepID=UPI003F9A9A2B
MAQRIPPEERLMNLTVALLGTEIGLTRAEIFSSVTGYVEQVSAGSDEAAMGRMFERDKETLVELGTRIEVIGDVVNPRNMRDARYRIPREDNSLPDDLEFTPGELAVLSLAADAWSEAAMSREARSGLRKIRALGYDVDEPILGFTPRLDARDESFAPLEDAIARGAEVTFDYLRPGSQRVRTRRVRPRALVMFESRWHLRGRDEALGEDRTFLLSRIVSDVRTTGVRFDPDDGDQSAEQTLEGLRALADGQRARIAAVPGSEAALRLGRRSLAGRDADELVVPYVDAYVLADEIASYGPEARVIEPHELRELVRDRLRAVRILHSRPADLRDADEAVAVRPARRRSTDGAERVRIYLTLVPWLLERADVTVADAAAEFGVTPAELRKMLATLSMVGEPTAGFYSGEMFDIDWDALDGHDTIRLTHTVGVERVQRFTTREVAALVAGLQLVAAVPGIADAGTLRDLRAKLARGAGTADRADQVLVDEPVDAARAELARAVQERVEVTFEYRRPGGETTTRTVDPSGLLIAGGQWYLRGWCHLREATRTFLIERIDGLVVTSVPAQHAADPQPGLFTPGDDDIVATLRFPTHVRPLIAGFLEHAELAERERETFARIPVADVATLRRLAARGGGDIEVLSPRNARDAARDWARSGEEHLDESPV